MSRGKILSRLARFRMLDQAAATVGRQCAASAFGKSCFFTNRRQLTDHRSRRKSSTNARTGYMAWAASAEIASIGIPENVEAVSISTLSAVSAKWRTSRCGSGKLPNPEEIATF
jgi:hypothetical protein